MLLKQKKIIKYFKKLQKQNDDREPANLVYRGNYINRNEFILFLLSKTNFLKNETKKNEKNVKKRWSDIESIIDCSVKKGFFEVYKDFLKLKIEGEEFIKPLRFYNTVLKEYGQIKSVVVAIIFSSIFWIFISSIVEKIQYIFKAIYNLITKLI